MDSLQRRFREGSDELVRFLKRVGKVWIYEELMFLGIVPECLTGQFSSKGVSVLLDFCAIDPTYHIISCQNLRIYNRYIPNANGYYLADGDKDSNLEYDVLGGLSKDEFLQVGHTVFAPVFRDIKSRE
jgi:hypothetical protein